MWCLCILHCCEYYTMTCVFILITAHQFAYCWFVFIEILQYCVFRSISLTKHLAFCCLPGLTRQKLLFSVMRKDTSTRPNSCTGMCYISSIDSAFAACLWEMASALRSCSGTKHRYRACVLDDGTMFLLVLSCLHYMHVYLKIHSSG